MFSLPRRAASAGPSTRRRSKRGRRSKLDPSDVWDIWDIWEEASAHLPIVPRVLFVLWRYKVAP